MRAAGGGVAAVDEAGPENEVHKRPAFLCRLRNQQESWRKNPRQTWVKNGNKKRKKVVVAVPARAGGSCGQWDLATKKKKKGGRPCQVR